MPQQNEGVYSTKIFTRLQSQQQQAAQSHWRKPVQVLQKSSLSPVAVVQHQQQQNDQKQIDPFFQSKNDRPKNSECTTDNNVTVTNSEVFINGHSVKPANNNLDTSSSTSALIEETKISKLIRKLQHENTDSESFMVFCQKLLDVIILPFNESYIHRSFDMLMLSIIDVFHTSLSDECKIEFSRVIGRIAFVLRKDYKRFLHWFSISYHENSPHGIYLITSFNELLQMPKYYHASIDDIIGLTIKKLLRILELTEDSDTFITIVNVLIIINENFTSKFTVHFRDTVDIIIGWHADETQSEFIQEFASKSLQSFKNYWKLHLDFSRNLVQQIFEDLENYFYCNKHTKKFFGLLRVYNTLLKCFHNHNQNDNSLILEQVFLLDSLTRILKISDILFKVDDFNVRQHEDLIISLNETVYLLTKHYKLKSLFIELLEFVKIQLNFIDKVGENCSVTIILVVTMIVKTLSANLPIDIIEHLIGPNCSLYKSRFLSKKIRNALLYLYVTLLDFKTNINVLHEVYKYIVGELEIAYSNFIPDIMILQPDDNPNPFAEIRFTDFEAKQVILFLIQSFCQLANTGNSIVGMWAFNPSLLRLLSCYLVPFDNRLKEIVPVVQHAIIGLLFAHTKCNGYFITSSNLLINDQNLAMNMNSTTANNLLIVFSTITRFFQNDSITNETTELLLNWTYDLLTALKIHFSVLLEYESWIEVLDSIISAGHTYDENVALLVCECLKIMAKLCASNYEKNPNKKRIIKEINNLCHLHICSNNERIKEAYINLLTFIPMGSVLETLSNVTVLSEAKLKRKKHSNTYDHHHIVFNKHCLMTYKNQTTHMKFDQLMRYLNYILNKPIEESDTINDSNRNEFLLNLFSEHDLLYSSNNTSANYNLNNYRELAVNSKSYLLFWCQWESALLLVNQKLKTDFGKAADTFNAIENCLRTYEIDLDERKFMNDHDQLLNLLNFLENLEKLMYNAIEGCAMALSTPDKPIVTFFTNNAKSCREWLTRIRLIIIKIAIHAGLSTIALRHCDFFLNDLLHNTPNIENNINNNEEILRIIFYMAVVYVNLNESSSLIGLYSWLKNNYKITYMTFLLILSKCSLNNFEIAYEFFLNVVKKSQKNLTLSCENYFLLYKTIDGLKNIQNWSELVHLENEFGNYVNQAENQCYFLDTIDLHKGQEMLDLENGLLTNYLNTWNVDSFENTWNIHSLKSNLENDLFKVSLQFNNCKEKVHYLENLSNNCLNNIVQKLFLNAPFDNSGDFLIMQRVLKKFLDLDLDDTNDPFNDETQIKSTQLLSKLFYWKELFKENFNSSFNLRLNLVKTARKQLNYNFAEKLIIEFFQKIFNNKFDNMRILVENLTEFKSKNKLFWSTHENYEMLYETSKLLYDTKNYDIALNLASISFMKIFNECYNNSLQIIKDEKMRFIGSKFIIKIADWLHNCDISILSSENSTINHIVKQMPDISIDPNSLISINLSEIAIGQLLSFNTDFHPDYAKVWNRFGTWCYKWGSRMVSNNIPNVTDTILRDISVVLDNYYVQYNEDDLIEIANIIRFKKSSISLNDDVLDIHDPNSNTTNGLDNLIEQLKNIQILNNNTKLIDDLVNISKEIRKSEYYLLELSTKAYFRFLSMNSSNQENCQDILTAALRLLRLTVRYALELQTVLDDGLANTPTKPWKAITLQLFARLNHPEIYIRKRVGDLLCRIAVTDPHLIMFPAVVGTVIDGDKLDISISDNDTNELHIDSKDKVLSSCFQTVVETLEKQSPEIINQVQQLVRELRRISLLWDELWLATLSHHYSELQNRIQKLQVEVEKVQSNQNLKESEKTEIIAEKHRIIMKPVIFILEQLKNVTFVEPQTENEHQFQKTFKKPINDTLEKLKNPENPDQPQESGRLLYSLYNKFRSKSRNRKSYTLKMSEISPVLANLRETKITMPGLSKSVSIRYVDNHVTILPTKTQPKKLMFKGSDGLKYHFLLKGLEDLHLDERIMQFLSIANTMMSKESNGQGLYKARYYSVIPLGPRSGLISWVDGTIPLFALYKSWQKRQYDKVAAPANSINTKPMSNENEVFHFIEETSKPIIRHSELFYQKLNPLLEKSGIKNLDNRQEWPLSILKQVLTDLMNETPKDLLSKEIWCYSVDSGMWWQMVKNYSHSLAVMSVIGYIIGLGDRHLDNVLIDLSNGEVVHIDYNVCFEKGKKLRIPEKVPFRMTSNLKHALGITGVEGTFRLACEHTLTVLRNQSETLLTLLEAFIYDPLVDWTVDAELLTTGSMIKKNKQEMDKEVTWAMFNVRCAEIRADWFANKNIMLKNLSEVISNTKLWINDLEVVNSFEGRLQDAHEQLALIKEAESQVKHKLYSLPTRYTDVKRNDIPDKPITEILQEKRDQFTKQFLSYEATISKLNSDEFKTYINNLEAIMNERYQLCNKCFKDSSTKLRHKIEKYASLENRMESLIKGQIFAVKSIFDFIDKYCKLSSLYSSFYLKNHRKIVYSKLIENVLEHNYLNDDFDQIVNEIQSSFRRKSIQDLEYKKVVEFMTDLYNMRDEVLKSIHSISERKKREGFSEESLKQYESSFSETKRILMNFIKNDEKATEKSFELVMILTICSLNKRVIQMEKAASSSGNCLVDLKTKEGSWFFDEMLFNNNLLVELAHFLQDNCQRLIDKNSNEIKILFKSIKFVNNVYLCLNNLHDNFLAIILPEAIKIIHAKDVSILTMIQEIKNLCFCSIDDILAQLEKHLNLTIMQMDSPFAKSQEIVAKLGEDFKNLIQKHTDCNSSGQMLFIALNGLFRSLQDEFEKMLDLIKMLKTQASWKQIDQFKDIDSFMSSILLNDETRQIISDIFLLKRLKTVIEFFGVCEDMWLKNESESMFYVTDEQFTKPMKCYIADFISKQMLGITPMIIAKTIVILLQNIGYQKTITDIEQRDSVNLDNNKIILEDLCKKSIDYAVKHGVFSNNILAQTYSFCSNYETAWKRKEVVKLLNKSLRIYNLKLERFDNSIHAYFWLFEDYFIIKSDLFPNAPKNLTHFLRELKNLMQILDENQISIKNLQKDLTQSYAKVENDLKKIDNQKLNLTESKKLLEFNENLLTAENQLVLIIQNIANDIMNYELYRINSEQAFELDEEFKCSIDTLRKLSNKEKLEVRISRVEENLMRISPTEVVDKKWLRKTTELLSEFISSQNQEINTLNETIFVNQQNIIMHARTLNECFDIHRNLMRDVYDLLKSMSKLVDSDEENSVKKYLNEYQDFIKNISIILTQLSSLKSNKEDLEDLLNRLYTVQDQICFIYDTLLEFEGNYGSNNGHVKSNASNVLFWESVDNQIENGNCSVNKGAESSFKKVTQRKVQQQNAYAISVWNRVKMKLEGRDPDPGQRSSVSEQVSFVIREATNLDNLALLYEGWTPWV